MTIDTLGYVKRLQAAGISREHAEAHAEAIRDDLVPQLATTPDLERLGDKLETVIWKHTVAIILAVFAVGGFLIRFTP